VSTTDRERVALAIHEARFAELRDWFEKAAIDLQAATPDGNNPARYKGPHPCDCAHFADDAIARVRTLLATPAPRIRELEEALRDAVSSLAGYRREMDEPQPCDAERRARTLIGGGSHD